MNEMIERVAKAISDYDETHVMPQVWHYEQAKVAIEAMREPNDKILDLLDLYNMSIKQYQNIIDATLKED